MTKRWWYSKTVWFNAFVSALTVLEANIQLFSAGMDPLYYALLFTGVGIVNIFLRAVTTQGIRA